MENFVDFEHDRFREIGSKNIVESRSVEYILCFLAVQFSRTHKQAQAVAVGGI